MTVFGGITQADLDYVFEVKWITLPTDSYNEIGSHNK
jgi:hypothetical protein